MHSAPAVRYPVARSPRVARAMAAVWLLGAGVCGWWASQPGLPAAHVALAVACPAATAVAALRLWLVLPLGELHWDGAWWQWAAVGRPDTPVALHVRVDFGDVLVLRLMGTARRPSWCCLDARTMPERWPDLRRAVFAARPADAVPAPEALG